MVELPKPAAYSHTDEAEVLAINTLECLLDPKKIKSDLKKRDKYPNVDGYLELVDCNNVSLGKVEIQVKKLPQNSGTDLKLSGVPLSLFGYSKTTTLPVLLIGVDVTQKKAYWIHINQNLAEVLGVNTNPHTTMTIPFPIQNVVDGRDTKYFEEWETIIRNYQTRLQEAALFKESHVKLLEQAHAVLGSSKAQFQDIHFFLDELNKLIDRTFPIIKKRFYVNTWKIGLAYYEYGDSSLFYTLYPIPLDKNDVQIKEVDTHLQEQLKTEGLGLNGHSKENPIKHNPKKYAKEICESKLQDILKWKLLYHTGAEFLAREFIFAFVDEFRQQLGLDKKDKYRLDELETAFYSYLPIWVNETLKFMVANKRNGVNSYYVAMRRKPYFDPDTLITQIMDEELKQIVLAVRTKLTEKVLAPSLPIDNDKFPFRIFTEFLSFLKSKDISEITRPYIPKDYSRLTTSKNWVWNVFSPAAVKTNLKIFFENLPKTYDDILSLNFPELKEKLPIFGDVSKVIIVFNVREEYPSDEDRRPTIRFFYLSGEKQEKIEIEVYQEGENKEADSLVASRHDINTELIVNGQKYKLVSMSSGLLKFIYDELPMFNFVYEILKDNLENYFRYSYS